MSGTLGGVLAIGVTVKPWTRPVECADRTSPFSAPWRATRDALAREQRVIGAEIAVLEVDLLPIDFRKDGGPHASRSPRSPGVRLTFRAAGLDGSPLRAFEAGEFSTWQDNVRAIALGLEALRKVDRYGITKRGEQYAGFRALPPGDVDLVARGHRIVAERYGGNVREALRHTHPDRGGDLEDFKAVNAARSAA